VACGYHSIGTLVVLFLGAGLPFSAATRRRRREEAMREKVYS